MAERKVLNKYIPPDFDPSLLPKGKRPKGGQVTVRIMLPVSVQCSSCNEYVYKGKKFNAKKELAVGEDYLGIKLWRFFFRCPHCMHEIRFKTDPKNADYTVESGASRNFEPWRQQAEADAMLQHQRHHDDTTDDMKRVENAMTDSKRALDISDALDMMQSRNAALADIDPLTLLSHRDDDTTAADNDAITAAFAHRRARNTNLDTDIELIMDHDHDDDDEYTTSDIMHRNTPSSAVPSSFAAIAHATDTLATPSISSSAPTHMVVIAKKQEKMKGKKKKSKKTSSKAAARTNRSSSMNALATLAAVATVPSASSRTRVSSTNKHIFGHSDASGTDIIIS